MKLPAFLIPVSRGGHTVPRLGPGTILFLAVVLAGCQPPTDEARWAERAADVTITRDDWGIPHIRGKTDADAVFGMVYAQAEDDFNRIEVNFLNAMGRLAEAEGESQIYRDLRMRLFIDPDDLRVQYAASPQWLRDLMDAWADGLNYYLSKHPETSPRVLDHFEPWMALSFSEGSIGGDIERINIRRLEEFYGHGPKVLVGARPAATGTMPSLAMVEDRLLGAFEETWSWDSLEEPTGSNGFAIAPSNSATGNALLWINPHTSFFFRAELHMSSDQGLNAYGAVTWGQFFVYQGFNEGSGWMHTSSGVDNIDEYLETVVERDGSFYYVYNDEERPMTERQVTVAFRTDAGMDEKQFTVYRTHHGPVVRDQDGVWVSVRLMEEPMNALIQSYSRTKAMNYAEFEETMELHTNSSNNTVFADREGNIAYFHANYIPRRDTQFDWTRPVDGSTSATEWDGVLAIDESPNMLNPPNGWIQNTNNWPYSVSGEFSPKIEDYASYVQRRGENARGVNAVRVLNGKTGFTMESLTEAAFDPHLSAFADVIPALVSAYDGRPRAGLAQQIELLRNWDYGWAAGSVETSLAVYWGEEVRRTARGAAQEADMSTMEYLVTPPARSLLLESLEVATARLVQDFGRWQTPWGEINRFQRLTGDIVQPFDDEGPSIPVGFPSASWGSLASFGARSYPGTVRRYGTSGNSFVAVVEFGDSLRARAITAGGLNSVPTSPHFNDQAQAYANGELREVYFYPEQLMGHTEREYHPGQ